MEKRKLNRITAGFIVLVVMVLILMFSNSLRRSSHITLPEEGSSPGQAEDTNASGGDALTVIAVTPETVQTAIETLTRPAAVQPGDPGGAAVGRRAAVPLRPPSRSAAAGHGQTAPLSDGQVRHTITDRGDHLYLVWQREQRLQRPCGGHHPG